MMAASSVDSCWMVTESASRPSNEFLCLNDKMIKELMYLLSF
jgi:hypothetical protein